LVAPKNEQKLGEKFASEHFWQTLSTKSQTIRVNMSGGQREQLKGYTQKANPDLWFSWVKVKIIEHMKNVDEYG
jgi:hypothetical protein